MSNLIIRADHNPMAGRPLVHVTPDIANWTYISFKVYRLSPGQMIELMTDCGETAAIVLEGTCDVRVGDDVFRAVGGRESVFVDESPEAVYVPRGRAMTLTAQVRAEIAVATAAGASGVGEPRHIRRADIPYERRGSGTTLRFIRHILDEHHPAEKLLLVEVVTPAGNWSSFPPHKHDQEMPGKETYLEETYYYRFDPPHGQAVQRVYDKVSMDTVLTPRDGDVVLVPRGYHPVAAIPGFQTYYLNVMAGHRRTWNYQLDEDYAHVAPKDGNIMGVLETKDR